MQLADANSFWSATSVVQVFSEHTGDSVEYKEYLGIGQKAQFIYANRQELDKEREYMDTNLGILIEVHKQFTAIEIWVGKATPEGGDKL